MAKGIVLLAVSSRREAVYSTATDIQFSATADSDGLGVVTLTRLHKLYYHSRGLNRRLYIGHLRG